jgi:hypothetical protein
MYQEQARRHGQDISTTTDDGTFAGGLRHITSVLPSLMNDILQHAPEAQKVCIKLSKGNIRKNSKSLITFCIIVALLSVLPFPLFIFVDSKLRMKL